MNSPIRTINICIIIPVVYLHSHSDVADGVFNHFRDERGKAHYLKQTVPS